MKTIDKKSLLIGILATVLVMITIGAVGKPSSEIGRYQFHDKNARLSIFDTTTGGLYGYDEKRSWILGVTIKQKD